MEIDEIKKLTLDLKFALSDDEARDIQNDFSILDKKLALFDKIDTTNVEEMIYPFDVETSFLREDTVGHYLSQDEALANVAKVKQGHVVVPKVVK